MRTLIVGLDGLEYNYVIKWGLKGLLQRNFGKHDVSMMEKLYTPLLWSAFLTGRDPREIGYTMEYIERQRVRGYPPLVKALASMRRRMLPRGDWKLRKLAMRLGLFDVRRSARNINLSEYGKRETFISALEREGYRVYSEELPSFNEEYENELFFRSTLIDLPGKPLSERLKRVGDSWRIVAERWRRAIEAVPVHDVTLFYSPFPDYAHHVFFREEELVFVKEYYRRLQGLPFLRELRKMAVLIVSDHGFIYERLTHSDHGFWSSNVDLLSTPRTILDFHDIVIDLVRMDDASDERRRESPRMHV